MAAARGGDRAALGQLFEELRSYLASKARTRLGVQLRVKVSPSDIVQETLMEAHRAFGRFQGTHRAELVVWLHGILQHRVRTAYRRYRRAEKRDVARELPLATGSDTAALSNHVVVDDSSPSQKAIRNEEQEILELTLRSLPPQYEQAIRLRNELRLSFQEMGSILDCTEDAAQKLWVRSIDALAKRLRRSGLTPPGSLTDQR